MPYKLLATDTSNVWDDDDKVVKVFYSKDEVVSLLESMACEMDSVISDIRREDMDFRQSPIYDCLKRDLKSLEENHHYYR